MRRVLSLLTLLLAAAFAAQAQTAGQTAAGARPSPPGLDVSQPSWLNINPAPLGGGFGTPVTGGGYPRALHHPTPLPGNRLSYRGGAVAGQSSQPSASDGMWRGSFVRVTNTGAVAVKSVRMEFVFTDPADGAEVLRVSHRSKKRLKPGDDYEYRKTVRRNARTRRGDGARMSVELTEVVYADGTVWHR